MGLLKRAFSKLSPSRASANFYDGGKYTLRNQDFNQASNANFERLATVDRDTMRARARWLHENNPIVANIDEAIINNSVGNGIGFQSNTGVDAIDSELESLWRDATDAHNIDVTGRFHFSDFQRIGLGQRMTDGEVLFQTVISKNKFFPLSLQAIEVDNLKRSSTFDLSGKQIVDGIVLNKYGKPSSYMFEDQITYKTYEVSARNIINYYKPSNRFSQYRGISEYKQTITSLKDFAGFHDATIQSARARANIGYVVESEGQNTRKPTSTNHGGVDYQLEMINGVFVEYLNNGEKLKVIDPAASGTGYKDFVDTVIRMIAAGRNVSYELAFRDFTKTNFSSARASLIQDHKLFSSNQEHMARYLLTPLYRRFVYVMMKAGNIKTIPQLDFWKNPSKYIKPMWVMPERVWVDPLKEINAVAKEVELGITTLTEVAKSKGKDFEEIVRQRVRENETLRAAGLIDANSAEIIKKERKK